ncbi:MAG: hypothetical protein JWQ82_1019, partial [Tardiphaga sp.]|nr:hypothetical protein [Tardiphaga sp.]
DAHWSEALGDRVRLNQALNFLRD